MPIRRARPEDADTLSDIARAAYAIYLPRMDREPAPMLQDFPAAISAGRVDVLRDPAGETVHGYIVHFVRDGDWFIENVAVHPDRQGSGAGARLLAHAEEAACAGGCDSIHLYTNAAMTENLGFYKRHGYRRVDRRREDGFDRVYFVKRLEARDGTSTA